MRDSEKCTDDVLDEFCQWTLDGKTWSRGCSDVRKQANRQYIPFSHLQEFFESNDRRKRILASLFPEGPEPGLLERDFSKYLRIFGILLCIGKGRFIRHFVRHESLSDENLPFEHPPANFPLSTDKDMLKAFQEHQWSFCALYLEVNFDRILTGQHILPIADCQRIGQSDNFMRRRIKLDAGYNKLSSFNGDAMVGHLAPRVNWTCKFYS